MNFLEIHNKIIAKCDSWDQETHEIVDQLYSMLQQAETDLEVLNLRLAKQWTKGSNLYTDSEMKTVVDHLMSDRDKEQNPYWYKDALDVIS